MAEVCFAPHPRPNLSPNPSPILTLTLTLNSNCTVEVYPNPNPNPTLHGGGVLCELRRARPRRAALRAALREPCACRAADRPGHGALEALREVLAARLAGAQPLQALTPDALRRAAHAAVAAAARARRAAARYLV